MLNWAFVYCAFFLLLPVLLFWEVLIKKKWRTACILRNQWAIHYYHCCCFFKSLYDIIARIIKSKRNNRPARSTTAPTLPSTPFVSSSVPTVDQHWGSCLLTRVQICLKGHTESTELPQAWWKRKLMLWVLSKRHVRKKEALWCGLTYQSTQLVALWSSLDARARVCVCVRVHLAHSSYAWTLLDVYIMC